MSDRTINVPEMIYISFIYSVNSMWFYRLVRGKINLSRETPICFFHPFSPFRFSFTRENLGYSLPLSARNPLFRFSFGDIPRGEVTSSRGSILFFKRDAFKARARLDSRHVHIGDEKEKLAACPRFLFFFYFKIIAIIYSIWIDR